MKHFDIDDIEKAIKQIPEITEEVKKELALRPSHYAKLAGYSRQYAYEITRPSDKWRKNIDPERIINLYRVIRDDQNMSGLSE